MKVTTNFPYKVDIDNRTCEFDLVNQSEEILTYKIITPENYFNGLDRNMIGLLKSGDYQLGVELNCSSTIFRKWYKPTNINEFSIDIERKNVASKFTMQVMVLVNKDLFEKGVMLRKGMPVAILGDYTTTLEGESSPLFNFQEAQNDTISYNFDSDCITIFLPKKHFEYLQLQKENPTFSVILLSHFAQLALKDALKYFTEDDSHADLNWFIELKNKWKEFSNSDDEFPSDEEHQDFIDFILKDPSISLVDHFISQSKNVDDDED